MQASGYDMKSRYQVIRSAFNAYDKIKEKEDQGIRPMYRRKTWKYVERRRENIQRKEKRKNWYKKGEYDTVIFLPATPESKLQKSYQEEIRIEDKGSRKIRIEN